MTVNANVNDQTVVARIVDDRIEATVGGGIGPAGSGGVITINGLGGNLTLAAVGGTWAVSGSTLTLTVTGGGGGGGGSTAWDDITGKPSTFTPSAHSQDHSTITDWDTSVRGVAMTVGGDSIDDSVGKIIRDIDTLHDVSVVPWQPNYIYLGSALGNHPWTLVEYGGIVYQLHDPHTSRPTFDATEQAYWRQHTASAPPTHSHAIGDTTGLQTALDAKAPITSPTFTGTVSGVTKAMVGLGSVDNTADASKPVSTAQAAADAAVQAAAIQRSNHTGTQLAATISDFVTNASAAAPVQSVAGRIGAVTLAKADVGLSNVDNTADASKPVSTAQAAADAAVQAAAIQRSNHTGTQAWSTIESAPTTLAGYGITDAAAASHSHGNVTSAGAIGSTADRIAVTTTAGALTTAAVGSGLSLSGGTLSATGGGGGVSDGNKGDITVSASGATWVINAGAVTAADLNSGAFSTIAQARAGNDTATIMSPQRVRELISYSRQVDLAGTVTANGGSVSTSAGAPGVRNLLTTTAANSYSSYGYGGPGGSYTMLSRSADQTRTDWSQPKWFYIRAFRTTGSTNGTFRVLYGAVSNTAPSSGTPFAQSLTGRGIGFSIQGRRLRIFTHDGTTLTDYDTGLDTEANGGNIMDFLVYSDGAGNVSVTYQTKATGPTTYTTTGGPTVEASGCAVTAQLTNTADGVANTWTFVNPMVSTL